MLVAWVGAMWIFLSGCVVVSLVSCESQLSVFTETILSVLLPDFMCITCRLIAPPAKVRRMRYLRLCVCFVFTALSCSCSERAQSGLIVSGLRDRIFAAPEVMSGLVLFGPPFFSIVLVRVFGFHHIAKINMRYKIWVYLHD